MQEKEHKIIAPGSSPVDLSERGQVSAQMGDAGERAERFQHKIHVLDESTIDKIAAGEVVERPASVVKELVENAIDAGATRVSISIASGGITMIRISDNGRGIAPEDIPYAFVRHATSKITSADDLMSLLSFGFRGEALSSIAAVSRTEMITKRAEDLTATRYCIEGGRERYREEIGAPDGTTITVRDLFFNTPARAKFLKTPMTEASHVSACVEQLILSNPEVAFELIVNGQVKLTSPGNGSVKDALYHIYGKGVTQSLLPVDAEEDGMKIEGFLGGSQISRGNRTYENYYVNGRYVRSRLIARAVEDGYTTRLMQHQYPFTCFFLTIDGKRVDVNVHPSKMEVRFSDEQKVYDFVVRAVRDALQGKTMIPKASLFPSKETVKEETKAAAREEKIAPFETKAAEMRESRKDEEALSEAAAPLFRETSSPYKTEPGASPGFHPLSNSHVKGTEEQNNLPAKEKETEVPMETSLAENSSEKEISPSENDSETGAPVAHASNPEDRPAGAPGEKDGKMETEREPGAATYVQESFLPEFMSQEAAPLRRIVGVVFKTYWIFEYEGKMYLMDQHAAHERVLFEKFMKMYEERKLSSQELLPPIIVTLNMMEETNLKAYMPAFEALGFEIEPFGGRDYAVRAVPYDLGTIDSEELFLSLLDSLETGNTTLNGLDIYVHRVATEACKAAVKGGGELSFSEAQKLIDDLMECQDPYHCPHGRPTLISFTEKDLEKRFKRIV